MPRRSRRYETRFQAAADSTSEGDTIVFKFGDRVLSPAESLDKATVEAVIERVLTSISVKSRGRDPIELEVKAADTINDVKAKIQTVWGIPLDQLPLTCGGASLDSGTLAAVPHGAVFGLTKSKGKGGKGQGGKGRGGKGGKGGKGKTALESSDTVQTEPWLPRVDGDAGNAD